MGCRLTGKEAETLSGDLEIKPGGIWDEFSVDDLLELPEGGASITQVAKGTASAAESGSLWLASPFVSVSIATWIVARLVQKQKLPQRKGS